MSDKIACNAAAMGLRVIEFQLGFIRELNMELSSVVSISIRSLGHHIAKPLVVRSQFGFSNRAILSSH
jgi:hypothetical protein